MTSMERWYAIHTHPKGEVLAEANLRRQEFVTYLPRYLRRRRHARRTDWAPMPLFPRYLFVRMDVEQVRWRAIHSTFGVQHLVCHGDKPAPLPESIVEAIQARHDDRGMVTIGAEPPPFAKGEVVRLTEGALADQVGLFEGVSDDERVTILLTLLGREVRVRVPVDTVRAYA